MRNLKDMKLCPKCKRVKFKKNFYKDRTRPCGLRGVCKICDCKKAKDYYDENTDMVLTRMSKQYYRKKEGK